MKVVCTLSNGYVADDLGWPLTTWNHQFSTFCVALCIFVIGDSKNFKCDVYRLNVQVTAYGRQTVPDWGVVRSCDPFKFWGSNHITGTAEPKVVKFDTHIRYINSTNIITYHQQKRCVCGHGTVLRFCCLLWCSASRGFVSDSWATCGRPYNTGVWQTDRQTDRRSNRRIHDDSMYGANIASRGKNVFDRGSRSHIPRCCVTTSIRAGRWALTLTYDLDFQSLPDELWSWFTQKNQVQWKQTDGSYGLPIALISRLTPSAVTRWRVFA